MGVFGGQTTLASAIQTKSAQASIKTLSKITNSLNSKWRVFFPINVDVKEDGSKVPSGLIACLEAGRKMDYNAFGTSFITYDLDSCETTVLDDGTTIIKKDLTELKDLQIILKALYNGIYNEEIVEAERLYKQKLEAGEPVTEATLDAKKKEIYTAYYGSNEEKVALLKKMRETNKSASLPQDLLSYLGTEIATIGVIVKMQDDGTPDIKTVQRFSLPAISNKRVNILNSDSFNKAFANVEDGFIEMRYEVIGTEINEAKRNAQFSSVEVGGQTSVFNLLTPENSEELKKKIKSLLIRNSQLMEEKITRYAKENNNVKDVVSKIKNYISDKKFTFRYMDLDNDDVKRAAKELSSSGFLTGVKQYGTEADLSEAIKGLIDSNRQSQADKEKEKSATVVTDTNVVSPTNQKANLATEEEFAPL